MGSIKLDSIPRTLPRNICPPRQIFSSPVGNLCECVSRLQLSTRAAFDAVSAAVSRGSGKTHTPADATTCAAGNMKSVRATALIFFLAMGGASVVLSADAQPPSLNPTTQAEGGIPEKAPPGWDQAAWTAIRENCERNLLEMARRAQLTATQRSVLPPLNLSHGDMMLCAHLSVRPRTSLQPSTADPRGGVPTPMPTPRPPA
jgi:hypothetical protein